MFVGVTLLKSLSRSDGGKTCFMSYYSTLCCSTNKLLLQCVWTWPTSEGNLRLWAELSWQRKGGLWANIHQCWSNQGLSAKHQPVDTGQADKDMSSFRTSHDNSPAFMSSCWKPKRFHRAGETQSEVGVEVNSQESLRWVCLKLCCSVVGFPSAPQRRFNSTLGFHYRNTHKNFVFTYNTHFSKYMSHFCVKFWVSEGSLAKVVSVTGE